MPESCPRPVHTPAPHEALRQIRLLSRRATSLNDAAAPLIPLSPPRVPRAVSAPLPPSHCPAPSTPLLHASLRRTSPRAPRAIAYLPPPSCPTSPRPRHRDPCADLITTCRTHYLHQLSRRGPAHIVVPTRGVSSAPVHSPSLPLRLLGRLTCFRDDERCRPGHQAATWRMGADRAGVTPGSRGVRGREAGDEGDEEVVDG